MRRKAFCPFGQCLCLGEECMFWSPTQGCLLQKLVIEVYVHVKERKGQGGCSGAGE